MTISRPWWDRDIHAARRPGLLVRNRVQAVLRAWFDGEGFVEIDTAALQVSPGNETHLHAFATRIEDGDASAEMYLRTSPEFAAKKLLAAGETQIFEFAKAFRNRDRGPINAPEFTMLEWYRTGSAHAATMDDAIAIVRCAAEVAETRVLKSRWGEADPFAEPERISVSEAFQRHAGVDLLNTLDENGAPQTDDLKRAASSAGIRVAADDTWSDAFSKLMAERIEPHLGRGRLTLLTDYPAPEAALARTSAEDPRVAERFELFAAGVELANGFGELTDAAEQRRRFEASMTEKQRLYGNRYPIDEDFLAALAVMPEAAGVALGFDRLVMLVVGADRVSDVQWAPVVSAGGTG